MRVTGVDTESKYTFQRRREYGVATQAARQLKGVRLLELNPSVYARFLSVLSARSKVVAARLAELGFVGKITPKDLVEKHGDVFTSKGLVERCVRDVSAACQKAGLNPDETKIFRFLRHGGIKKKPPILSILHPKGEVKVKRQPKPEEPPTPELLAAKRKMDKFAKPYWGQTRAFFAERRETVEW